MQVQPVHLSRGALALLGGVLAAIAFVQQLVLNIPDRWHIVIVVAVSVLGAYGATLAGASAIATLLPPAVSSVIATLVIALNAVVLALPAADTLQGVLAAALTFFSTIGFKVVAPPAARAG